MDVDIAAAEERVSAALANFFQYSLFLPVHSNKNSTLFPFFY
jgi:hypothetical protein